MNTKTVRIEIDNETRVEKIKKAIGDQCACYVLITCSHPNQMGQMDVQMHFEGDETLAAFLTENAVQVFDEQISQRESK